MILVRIIFTVLISTFICTTSICQQNIDNIKAPTKADLIRSEAAKVKPRKADVIEAYRVYNTGCVHENFRDILQTINNDYDNYHYSVDVLMSSPTSTIWADCSHGDRTKITCRDALELDIYRTSSNLKIKKSSIKFDISNNIAFLSLNINSNSINSTTQSYKIENLERLNLGRDRNGCEYFIIYGNYKEYSISFSFTKVTRLF